MARKSKNEVESEHEPETVEHTEAEKASSRKDKKAKKDKKEKRDKSSKASKKEKKEKKAKKEKSSKEASASQATEPEAKVEPQADAKVEAETTDSADNAELTALQADTDSMFKSVLESANEQRDVVKNIVAAVRTLQRQVNKERKETAKVLKKLAKGQRKKRRGGNKTPGGFTKPTALSAPMCEFLGKPTGTELPRTEVTRLVNTYVKEKGLQNPENKKIILPDARLKSLLFLGDDDELTYFNLQSFMKYHFLKRDPKTGEVAEFAPPTTATA